jgi:DNA-binding winged helix-turn-helix (wHTH) protein/tetratricopeptide (TPR) repeat protein
MNLHKPTVFAFAGFVYDSENRSLIRNRIPVRINRQMLELLDLLIRNGGRLVTRDQIQTALWPDQFIENRDKQITNAVSRLRHILGDDSARPRYIESVPRTGYRMIVKVSLVESPSGKAAPSANTVPSEATTRENPTHSIPQPEVGINPAGAAPAETTHPAASQIASPPAIPPPPVAHSPSSWRTAFYSAAVLLLLGTLVTVWRLSARHAAPQPAEISLGIAPFQTSGPGAASLAQSFRLDLTDALAQLPHVNVRASNSLNLVSLDQATFRDQATRLGLDVLIIGSFAIENNNCHVQLELVRGKDLTHIAYFDRTVSRFELASLRKMIHDDVYTSLKLAPTSGGLSSSPLGGTSDPRAYDAYLRARYHYSQQSKESLPLAIAEFNEAIAADPQFVNAYAGEARTYFFLLQNDLIGEKDGFRLANETARHALALDPRSAEAHAVLGFIYFLHDANLSAGESELRQAIAIDPNDPVYHQGLALIFCDQARFREAEEEIDHAHTTDPFWLSAYVTEAHIASIAKDRPRVQATIRKIMELAPDSTHARDAIGNAQWNLGLYTDAIATWREMAVIEKDSSRVAIEDWGLAAYRKGGVRAYARVRLDAIHDGMNTAPHSNDFFPPEWYAQANLPEQALKAIKASVAAHDGSVPGMAVLPAYDPLRSNPDFQSILASLGLTLPTNPNANNLPVAEMKRQHDPHH